MTYDHWKTIDPAWAEWPPTPPTDEEMNEMIDEAHNRMGRMVANRQRAASRVDIPAPSNFATPTGLRCHHHEMLATMAAEQPMHIGRCDLLDATDLEILAEHLQAIANAFAAYARAVIREFAQHADIRRTEVEGYLADNVKDALGALFLAIEAKREGEQSW